MNYRSVGFTFILGSINGALSPVTSASAEQQNTTGEAEMIANGNDTYTIYYESSTLFRRQISQGGRVLSTSLSY